MVILAYLTLKAFIYKGIKSAKVVGGLEIHFGGLYKHYLEQILLEKRNFLVKTNNICEKPFYFKRKSIDFSRKNFYNLGESKSKRCIL